MRKQKPNHLPLSEDINVPKRLDATDEAIVAQLQEDGRRSYRAIAGNLDISEPTVRWRVRRLLNSGVLRIAAIADPFRLGYGVQAAILVKVAPGALESLVAKVVTWPEVMYVSSCTGRVDIYMQVVCRDQQDLWQLLAVRLPAVGGVVETETLMELKVHKLAYVYPNLSGPDRNDGARSSSTKQSSAVQPHRSRSRRPSP